MTPDPVMPTSTSVDPASVETTQVETTQIEGGDTAWDFEQRARDRVTGLSRDIDLHTFAAAFNLFRVSSQLVQDLEATVHRPAGLSIAGFRILFTVWTLGDLQPRQLAALSGVSRAAVSGVLNTLERDGLVERLREHSDGRLVTVRLTEDGAERVQAVYRAQNRRERELFASLDDDELDVLSSFIRRLLAPDASD